MSERATIDVRPATPERWADVEALLGGDGDKGCWCQAWRGTDSARKALGLTRPGILRDQIEHDVPPPGYLAYLDELPVGWAGVSVRTTTPRLIGSRTIPAVDDLPVWAIGCLRVRPGYRRRGITGALLDGVVTAARTAGAPGVEAYPIDPAGRRVDGTLAFVGIASTFDKAGFERILQTAARSGGLPRQLVRLMFEPDPG